MLKIVAVLALVIVTTPAFAGAQAKGKTCAGGYTYLHGSPATWPVWAKTVDWCVKPWAENPMAKKH